MKKLRNIINVLPRQKRLTFLLNLWQFCPFFQIPLKINVFSLHFSVAIETAYFVGDDWNMFPQKNEKNK